MYAFVYNENCYRYLNVDKICVFISSEEVAGIFLPLKSHTKAVWCIFVTWCIICDWLTRPIAVSQLPKHWFWLTYADESGWGNGVSL